MDRLDKEWSVRKARINKHIGARIREYREALGWTADTLAKKVGVAFQQIYRYEAGEDGVALSTLARVAEVYGKPIGYFYEGLPPPPQLSQERAAKLAQTMEFVNDTMKIKDERRLRCVSGLALSLAQRD